MGINSKAMTEAKMTDSVAIEPYGSQEYQTKVGPEMELVITVPDSLVQSVLSTIVHGVNTGVAGDGRIIVSSIEKIIDLEDEEIDENMLQWFQLTK